MYFLTVLTLATAALAVPFRHRAVGPAFPAVPAAFSATAPGTAPTGGSTGFPAVAEPTPLYFPSVSYATTSASVAEATAPSVATLPARIPEGSPDAASPVSAPVDPPASFPTANFAPVPVTAPTGGSSGFAPFQPQATSYSVSVSYARTAGAVPTPF
ncbi:hypothetical protein F5Y05DRAFT_292384 [Hypoxylon sp. FL0543]|nr:hypothetical protein F5Y05DRAFT_292384 [Hypoxylon sp. FL0543]